MPLVVETPPSYLSERSYALRVVLTETLGIEFARAEGPAGVVRIRGDDRGVLEMPDVLFDVDPSHWLTPRCLPRVPLTNVHVDGPDLASAVVNPDVPVILGTAPPLVEQRDSSAIALNLDVFGTAFFMLSRMEELIRTERDDYGRFPAEASLACAQGFVTRPIVDEYVQLLWGGIRRLWPRIERKPATFSVFSTHDVDAAFAYRRMKLRHLGRSVGHHALSGDLRTARRAISQWAAVKRRGIGADPWNTYDFVVDTAARAGWPCAFFFIADADPVGREERYLYRLEDPEIVELIRGLGDRGCEIGLHPSYRSHLDTDQVRHELQRLRSTCEAVGVDQDGWGGRAHFLRWESGASPRIWADAGLGYDSTLGYAERPGFRCGTCRPFPLYDLEARVELGLWERPLVLMDGSLTDPKYLGLAPDGEEARGTVLELRERCRRVGGEFVILWHQNRLTTPEHRELYTAALTGQ